jgi:hypothetical protein
MRSNVIEAVIGLLGDSIVRPLMLGLCGAQGSDANSDAGPIRVEVRREGRSVNIEWPASAPRVCALLLKELMR